MTPLYIFDLDGTLALIEHRRHLVEFRDCSTCGGHGVVAMTEYDRRRLVAVFDDRDKVVSMWRARGVACFQVAPGAF